MNKLARKIAGFITAAAVAVTSLGALPDIPAPTGFVVPASAEGDVVPVSPESDFGSPLAQYDPAHISMNEAGTEFYIHSAEGWKFFCEILLNNDKGFFTGKIVKLDADISTSDMAGSADKPFTGMFDGQLHLIIFNNTTGDDHIAPFAYAENCTVQSLLTTGKIQSEGTYSGGIIGQSSGTNTLRGCTSAISILSKNAAGGLVGELCSGTLTVDGCVYDGVMRSPAETGDATERGFVGRITGGTLNVINSVFGPAEYFYSDKLESEEIGDKIIIYNWYGWKKFATKVNEGKTYAGKTVILATDIPSTSYRVKGTEFKSFRGTFDGQGHTIENLNLGAPFEVIEDATIKNLNVVGYSNTTSNFTGGIIGEAKGTCTLINCRSSVVIKGSGVNCGGLVGKANSMKI